MEARAIDKKVLLIDDEPSLRRSVSVGLMQQGYQTEPCENGMKALQTLEMFKKKNIPLDYAIVDIKLPDIDGLKLLKVIKFNYPTLPVIVITGYGSAATLEEAKTQNADAYLEKPFSADDLAKVLASINAAEAEKAAPDTKPTESAATALSVSAYALVSLEESANLLKIYRKLYFQENVLYCDAIRGDHDIVLLLQAPTFDEIQNVVEKEVKGIEGVADVTLLSVDAPVFEENIVSIMSSVDKALGRDKEESEVYAGQPVRIKASSYVMLEIEKEKLEAIYPVLYFDDQVVYCDYVRGKYDIVLLMKGSSFAEIDSVIKNKFKPLDGVLRIREWPIITLFE